MQWAGHVLNDMKKHTELFLGSFLYPLLLLIVTGMGTLLWSKLRTGDWLTYLSSKPNMVLLIAAGTVLIWTVIFVHKRSKNIRQNAVLGPVSVSRPTFGWEEVNEYLFKDVLWPIRVPAEPPWQLLRRTLPSPSDIDVGIPPRCAECKTELEEKETFWGKYKWTCPRCGFSKKNSYSFYAESERVEKLAHRDFREFLRHKNADHY